MTWWVWDIGGLGLMFGWLSFFLFWGRWWWRREEVSLLLGIFSDCGGFDVWCLVARERERGVKEGRLE